MRTRPGDVSDRGSGPVPHGPMREHTTRSPNGDRSLMHTSAATRAPGITAAASLMLALLGTVTAGGAQAGEATAAAPCIATPGLAAIATATTCTRYVVPFPSTSQYLAEGVEVPAGSIAARLLGPDQVPPSPWIDPITTVTHYPLPDGRTVVLTPIPWFPPEETPPVAAPTPAPPAPTPAPPVASPSPVVAPAPVVTPRQVRLGRTTVGRQAGVVLRGTGLARNSSVTVTDRYVVKQRGRSVVRTVRIGTFRTDAAGQLTARVKPVAVAGRHTLLVRDRVGTTRLAVTVR